MGNSAGGKQSIVLRRVILFNSYYRILVRLDKGKQIEVCVLHICMQFRVPNGEKVIQEEGGERGCLQKTATSLKINFRGRKTSSKVGR